MTILYRFVLCLFFSFYCVSSILFLMCCSMVSVLYISKRSKQNNQSKQSNHRKSRKASKACKVSKANIFCIFVDVVCGGLFCICLLMFFCLLMILASSLLCALFTLFRSRSHRRFPVPLSLQVPESACSCRQLEVVSIGFPLGKEQRGRVREGEKDKGGRRRPPHFLVHFGSIF